MFTDNGNNLKLMVYPKKLSGFDFI